MSSTNDKINSDQTFHSPERFSLMSPPITDMKQRLFNDSPPHLTLENHVPNGSIPLWIQPVPYGSSRDRFFHTHEFSEIVIITEGEVDHIINNESVHLCKGDVLCLHPGVTHCYVGCSHMALVNVIYDIPRLALPCFDAFTLSKFNVFFPSEHEKATPSPISPILHLNDIEFQKVMGIITAFSMELNGNVCGKGLMALSFFINLVITLSRLMQPDNNTENPNFPERIGFTIDYLNSHFRENISTEKLAHLACTSKRTLFRLFKQKTGMKISEYLRKLRLQKAYTLLLCTNDPVQKIAWQCGFSSDNRFCKVFHAVNNCTPLEFRTHARKIHADKAKTETFPEIEDTPVTFPGSRRKTLLQKRGRNYGSSQPSHN